MMDCCKYRVNGVIGMKPVVLVLLALLTFSSCFKEENLAPPKVGGIGNTAVIEMGPEYADQYFYNITENRVISTNSRLAYDLMFDCAPGKFNVWLNTARFMCAIRTGKNDFAAVNIEDTVGAEWHYELGEYTIDSNAIGTWGNFALQEPTSYNQVYIVSLGLDANNNPAGFIKVRMKNFAGNSYTIEYQAFGSNQINNILVSKDNAYNYRYVTFSNGPRVVDGIEPEKAAWDFCFTRYTVIFYEPTFLPYEVTGVLHNPAKVSAYMDSTYTFNDVTLGDFDVNRLQTRRDAIGYDWKRYELGDYTTKTHYTYFVKTDELHLYKLRFLDFKKNGVKGYPTFEYQQL